MRCIGSAQRIAGLSAAVLLFAGCGGDQPPPDAATAKTTAPTTTEGVCKRVAEGEAGDLALARCLAAPELIPHDSAASHDVVVYFDRSGSMRGFLDPKYPTRIPTDYRSVIDRLVVGLRPTRGFSFGSALRPAEPSLVTFGNREFYTDRDTQTEQVLKEIAKDTAGRETHIIVTDGRRGSPNAGDAQYVRLREHGARWLQHGGAFVVATSLAPFQTVTGDPSGCREAKSASDEPQTCPLYVFGFIAAGDEWRITTALASVFEHLYIWPTPTIPPAALMLVPADADRRDLRIERRWATGAKGTPIVRVRGDSATNRVLSVRVEVRDTSTAVGRTYARLLRDQALGLEMYSRAFTPGPVPTTWVASEARGSLVRPAAEPSAEGVESTDWRRTIDIVTRGPRAPVSMFMVDLLPAGKPLWLDRFAAEDASDVVRTYGLSRLFEKFQGEAEQVTTGPRRASPLGRFFIVAS